MLNILCVKQEKKLLHEKLHFSKDGKETKDFLFNNSFREISFRLYNFLLAVLTEKIMKTSH